MKMPPAQARHRLRSCFAKKRYVTWKHATRTARFRMSRQCGSNLRVYPCHYCGGYHLTSAPLSITTGATA